MKNNKKIVHKKRIKIKQILVNTNNNKVQKKRLKINISNKKLPTNNNNEYISFILFINLNFFIPFIS